MVRLQVPPVLQQTTLVQQLRRTEIAMVIPSVLQPLLLIISAILPLPIVIVMAIPQVQPDQILIILEIPPRTTMIPMDVPLALQEVIPTILAQQRQHIVIRMGKHGVLPLHPLIILEHEVLSTTATTQVTTSGRGKDIKEGRFDATLSTFLLLSYTNNQCLFYKFS